MTVPGEIVELRRETGTRSPASDGDRRQKEGASPRQYGEGLIPSPLRTYATVRRVFSGVMRALYRLEVIGAERLPATGPAIVASNHESWLDGIILGAALPRDLRFVAKAELWRSRLLAWMLDGLGAIPLERGRGDYLAAARVLQALEAGQAVVIFPQGAVRGDRVWKQGAAHAALVTGAPVAAAALTERVRLAVDALRAAPAAPAQA